jgi:2,3-bisphosphoglycerate-independent phosphoglycerate mutase
MAAKKPFVHLFFMDGVGLGNSDPTINPFMTADLPNLLALLGREWYLQRKGPIIGERASFIPTDANLGIPGRPQSATGQATILTGRNVPRLIGDHYGPKPNPAVAEIIQQGSLFAEVMDAGRSAALITPYPQGYFDAIESGKRLLSAVPLAATCAGLRLLGAEDLRQGQAVSPDFTARGWRDHLGYSDMPVLSLAEAGLRIAKIAAAHDFTFFEHWPSDQTGHRGSLEEAVEHLEQIDRVLGGLFAAWDETHGLLIITSDHGNIEEKNHRQHTRNPVPTILFGRNHSVYAYHIRMLDDVAGVVRRHLNLPAITHFSYSIDQIA